MSYFSVSLLHTLSKVFMIAGFLFITGAVYVFFRYHIISVIKRILDPTGSKRIKAQETRKQKEQDKQRKKEEKTEGKADTVSAATDISVELAEDEMPTSKLDPSVDPSDEVPKHKEPVIVGGNIEEGETGLLHEAKEPSFTITRKIIRTYKREEG